MAKRHIKKFRLDDLQLHQLEQFLIKENLTFTDFIQYLIANAVMQNAHTVTPNPAASAVKAKTKTIVEIVKRYQNVDPALLLELSRIGNNINQIARALNVIKNADADQQRHLNIFQLLMTLKNLQNELEQLFPKLPKIQRTTQDNFKKQLSSIQLAEQNESAY